MTLAMLAFAFWAAVAAFRHWRRPIDFEMAQARLDEMSEAERAYLRILTEGELR